MPPRLTCGVLVTDGTHLLIAHATRTPRWDIPKGLANPDEPAIEAARRELREETGLDAPTLIPPTLIPLGTHPYLRGKHLALFAWQVPTMPDPAQLRCTSMVHRPNQAPFPELDQFAVLPWDAALARLIPAMSRILAPIRAIIRPNLPTP